MITTQCFSPLFPLTPFTVNIPTTARSLLLTLLIQILDRSLELGAVAIYISFFSDAARPLSTRPLQCLDIYCIAPGSQYNSRVVQHNLLRNFSRGSLNGGQNSAATTATTTCITTTDFIVAI